MCNFDLFNCLEWNLRTTSDRDETEEEEGWEDRENMENMNVNWYLRSKLSSRRRRDFFRKT